MDVYVQRKSLEVGYSTESRTITLDGSVYPSAAILRTCYALADMATFDIANGADTVSVHIVPAKGQLLEAVVERFRTSLIDFTLREDIEARTRGMRELIWQTAFGETQKRNAP